MRACFALLVFAATGLSAAIDPRYELERRQNAPEVLKVRIAETRLVPLRRISCAERYGSPRAVGTQLQSEFTAKLKVLETLRSESRVKAGAVITIRYEVEVEEDNCLRPPGPARRVPLKKAEVRYAYLGTVTKTNSGLTTPGGSFGSDRPKLKAKRPAAN
jgi:hypothetical protein